MAFGLARSLDQNAGDATTKSPIAWTLALGTSLWLACTETGMGGPQ